jgi:hypothetical protein
MTVGSDFKLKDNSDMEKSSPPCPVSEDEGRMGDSDRSLEPLAGKVISDSGECIVKKFIIM